MHTASMNKLFKKFKKFTKKHVPSMETAHLLSATEQPKNSKALKTTIKGVTNSFKLIYNPASEHWKCKDKNIRKLIEDFQYHEACVKFCKLEDSGADDGREFYKAISQKMWEQLTKALAGDQSQSTRLQIIPQCLQWARETQSKKGSEWGPKRWPLELEDLFEEDIKGTIPIFAQNTVDKQGLKNHLEQLNHKIFEITTKVQRFPVELTSTYLKCLHDYLLNDLNTMAEGKLDYEEQILLYKWTRKEHGKLCKYLQGSVDYDHMLYESWFFNMGNKITSTGQEAIQTALKNILEQEIVWNHNPSIAVQCHFYTIQEKMTGICEAVKDISSTLVARLNSICWEDFLKFLTRYEDFLKNKVDKAEGMASGNGVEIGLRIVNNGHILRETLLGLDKNEHKSEIRKLLEQCEHKGIEIILRILIPKLKSAFKKFFKRNQSSYEHDLTEYREALKKQDIENSEKLNTVIQHRITVLYIQEFFKSNGRRKAEAFVQGTNTLKDFFTELVSNKKQLGEDPLKFMVQMLTASDYKSLQTTVVFFLIAHEDIRKEHLKAILKIKGGINHKDRKNLLDCVKDRIDAMEYKEGKNLLEKNRQTRFNEDRLKFFKDVHIGGCCWKLLQGFKFLCLGPF